MRRFYKFLLKLSGWRINGELPPLKKFVICVAPHTSNLDFFVGKIAYSSLGGELSFLIKREWMVPPFIWFLRPLGAIAVDRSKSNSLTDSLAEMFGECDSLHLAVTPEGTRKYNPVWKRGFYHIALKAGVPILVVGLDFKIKEVRVLDLFYPTGDEDSDIKAIKRMYVGITAKHPRQFSVGEI